MRTMILMLALTFHCAAAASAQTAPGLPLWMTGCWEMADGEMRIVEHWRAEDGYLMGMGETWRGGRRIAGETMRVSMEAAGPIFHAAPEGQAPVRFAATSTRPAAIVFENAAHDFPQRIDYRLNQAGDSLLATVSALDRPDAGLHFSYRSIECP